MNIEQAVVEALLASTDLAAIVGIGVYTEIPDQDPPFPFVLFSRGATEYVNTIHDGVPIASKANVHVTAWAKTSLQAETMATIAVTALRDIAIPVDRFAHYEETMDANGVIVAFEIWDV